MSTAPPLPPPPDTPQPRIDQAPIQPVPDAPQRVANAASALVTVAVIDAGFEVFSFVGIGSPSTVDWIGLIVSLIRSAVLIGLSLLIRHNSMTALILGIVILVVTDLFSIGLSALAGRWVSVGISLLVTVYFVSILVRGIPGIRALRDQTIA